MLIQCDITIRLYLKTFISSVILTFYENNDLFVTKDKLFMGSI